MADPSQKNAHPTASTGGVPQAQPTPAAQRGASSQGFQTQPSVQAQPRSRTPIAQNAAQEPQAQPKRAPQPRTLAGSSVPHPPAAQRRTPPVNAVAARNSTQQQEKSSPAVGAHSAQGDTRGKAPARGSRGAIQGGQAVPGAQRAPGKADALGESASAASKEDKSSAAFQESRQTAPSLSSKARPRKHTDAQSAKPRATRSTVPLHSTAILQLEQIARSMQRGVNEGALMEADAADKLPFRLLINALGQMLYRIGQQTEYILLRVWRTLRRAGHLLTTGILLLLRTFLRPIGALAAGIWHDLTSPFVRLFVGVKNAFQSMREASSRGESAFAAGVAYAKQGIKAYRHVGLTALSYVLPLAAAAVLAITVRSVLNTPFSLAVTYNEKMIGYVENEAVWESAKKKITDRIRVSSHDDTFDARPQFNVVSVQVAARRSALEMVDIIISESSDQIQNATGVYVGDTLAGVCTDGEGVQQMLDTTLAAARPVEDPTARVQFVNSVTPERGLYFTDSISTLTQLESTLQANNWLQVKLIRTEVHTDVMEFETVEEENPSAYKGTTRVKQRGVNGQKIVTDDVAYINGVEVERVMLSEQITKEAVPKIVTVGTKEVGAMGSYDGPILQGSGSLLWPVPDFSYTTTEFGYHRGIDICAPYGTSVHACDSGTVIEAGWHWSWGYYVLIDHSNGITTRYAHNSSMAVTPGQNVGKGDVIAYVGSTGTSSGNHCHLEITVNGGLVNPRRFIVQP